IMIPPEASRTSMTTGIISYRPLTEDEKSAFKPMIEPFESGQVRHRERDPSLDEYNLYDLLIRQGAGDSMLLSRMEEKTQTIHSVRKDPLLGLQILDKAVSWGTSSYGYDVRCS